MTGSKHNLYNINPVLNRWEEDKYARLMERKVKGAKSAGYAACNKSPARRMPSSSSSSNNGHQCCSNLQPAQRDDAHVLQQLAQLPQVLQHLHKQQHTWADPGAPDQQRDTDTALAGDTTTALPQAAAAAAAAVAAMTAGEAAAQPHKLLDCLSLAAAPLMSLLQQLSAQPAFTGSTKHHTLQGPATAAAAVAAAAGGPRTQHSPSSPTGDVCPSQLEGMQAHDNVGSSSAQCAGGDSIRNPCRNNRNNSSISDRGKCRAAASPCRGAARRAQQQGERQPAAVTPRPAWDDHYREPPPVGFAGFQPLSKPPPAAADTGKQRPPQKHRQQHQQQQHAHNPTQRPCRTGIDATALIQREAKATAVKATTAAPMAAAAADGVDGHNPACCILRSVAAAPTATRQRKTTAAAVSTYSSSKGKANQQAHRRPVPLDVQCVNGNRAVKPSQLGAGGSSSNNSKLADGARATAYGSSATTAVAAVTAAGMSNLPGTSLHLHLGLLPTATTAAALRYENCRDTDDLSSRSSTIVRTEQHAVLCPPPEGAPPSTMIQAAPGAPVLQQAQAFGGTCAAGQLYLPLVQHLSRRSSTASSTDHTSWGSSHCSSRGDSRCNVQGQQQDEVLGGVQCYTHAAMALSEAQCATGTAATAAAAGGDAGTSSMTAGATRMALAPSLDLVGTDLQLQAFDMLLAVSNSCQGRIWATQLRAAAADLHVVGAAAAAEADAHGNVAVRSLQGSVCHELGVTAGTGTGHQAHCFNGQQGAFAATDSTGALSCMALHGPAPTLLHVERGALGDLAQHQGAAVMPAARAQGRCSVLGAVTCCCMDINPTRPDRAAGDSCWEPSATVLQCCSESSTGQSEALDDAYEDEVWEQEE